MRRKQSFRLAFYPAKQEEGYKLRLRSTVERVTRDRGRFGFLLPQNDHVKFSQLQRESILNGHFPAKTYSSDLPVGGQSGFGWDPGRSAGQAYGTRRTDED